MSDIKTAPQPFMALRPEWLRRGDEASEIIGVEFDCPCGTPPNHVCVDAATNKCECGAVDCPSLCGPECIYKAAPGCAFGPRINVYFDTYVERNGQMPLWTREGGDSLESFGMNPSLHCVGHWHGWIKGGLVTSC